MLSGGLLFSALLRRFAALKCLNQRSLIAGGSSVIYRGRIGRI